MRFLPHEHKAITAALETHGIDPRSILFVKRHGRLHVELPGRSDAFIFFREKNTKLDERGHWQEGTDYFIGAARDKSTARGWSQVMEAFVTWLGAR